MYLVEVLLTVRTNPKVCDAGKWGELQIPEREQALLGYVQASNSDTHITSGFSVPFQRLMSILQHSAWQKGCPYHTIGFDTACTRFPRHLQSFKTALRCTLSLDFLICVPT